MWCNMETTKKRNFQVTVSKVNNTTITESKTFSIYGLKSKTAFQLCDELKELIEGKYG